MGHSYAFEKLRVWKEAIELVKALYRILAGFPVEEQYNLASQMKRAAISISSNLAEGSTKATDREKVRFYRISYGSAIELLSQLILAREPGFIQQNDFIRIRDYIESITNKINALKIYTLRRNLQTI